jgi:hypothetical protein
MLLNQGAIDAAAGFVVGVLTMLGVFPSFEEFLNGIKGPQGPPKALQ